MTDEIAAPAQPEANEAAAPAVSTEKPAAVEAPKETAATTMRRVFEDAMKKNPEWKPRGEQPRAADGKFAPVETKSEKPTDAVHEAAKPDAAAPAQDATAKPDAQKAEPQKPQKAAVVQMPSFLSTTERAALAKLAPAEQTAIISRIRQIQGASDKARVAYEKQVSDLGDVGKVLNERREAWARNGMLPGQAVAQLIAYSDWAAKDPVDFIVKLASARQIDLPALVDQMRAPADPQLRALQTETQRLRAEQEAWRRHQAEQEARQLEAKKASSLSIVDRFSTATSSAGTPLRPHWEDVKGTVLANLKTLREANPSAEFGEAELQRAYDAAVALHPELRAQTIEAEIKARQDKARQDAEARAKAARSASASIPSQPIPSVRTVAVPKSGADHLRMLMRERGMSV